MAQNVGGLASDLGKVLGLTQLVVAPLEAERELNFELRGRGGGVRGKWGGFPH